MKVENMFKLPETAQEVFNIVYKHLLKQNKQSLDGDQCLYRHGDLKCAAGALIPDEAYDNERFEGFGWGSLVRKELVPNDHCQLIADLQSIHDDVDVVDWKHTLEELADRRNLSVPSLEETNV